MLYIYIYIYIHIHTHTSVSLSLSLYIYIYIYIYPSRPGADGPDEVAERPAQAGMLGDTSAADFIHFRKVRHRVCYVYLCILYYIREGGTAISVLEVSVLKIPESRIRK